MYLIIIIISQLSNTHIFFPVAIETAGTWHYKAVELIQEVGRRTANITGDARETTIPVPAAAVHCTTEGKCGLIRVIPDTPKFGAVRRTAHENRTFW